MTLIHVLFLYYRLTKRRQLSHIWLPPFYLSLDHLKLQISWPFWHHGESPIPHSLSNKKSLNYWNASTSTPKSPEPIYQLLSHLNMSLANMHHRDASLKFCCSIQICNLSHQLKICHPIKRGKQHTLLPE
jgi:hypothetical protein